MWNVCKFGELKITELWLRLQEHTNECEVPQCILMPVHPCGIWRCKMGANTNSLCTCAIALCLTSTWTMFLWHCCHTNRKLGALIRHWTSRSCFSFINCHYLIVCLGLYSVFGVFKENTTSQIHILREKAQNMDTMCNVAKEASVKWLWSGIFECFYHFLIVLKMKEGEGKYLGALLDPFHRSHTFVPG